jgi:hypothetical protein
LINMRLDSLSAQIGRTILPASLVEISPDEALWLERAPQGQQLAWLTTPDQAAATSLSSSVEAVDEQRVVVRSALTAAAAAVVRARVPGLQPRPLGLTRSAGFGDRLGLATPGHVAALRAVTAARPNHPIAPLFAQQSIREMTRAGRSPDEVMTDATFGALAAGWRGPLGADADHLKTPADIDRCLAAGFSLFTFDPGAHVDSDADQASPDQVQAAVAALPWQTLECTPDDWRRRYADQAFALEDAPLTITVDDAWRAAMKYGRAIAHVVDLYRHLARASDRAFEVEVSVDETETPTSFAEHLIFVNELRRLSVRWASLAPRFIGRFEKGVDYIGDLGALAHHLHGHAAIARVYGPYKLSLHSGSDKFSVYPLIADATRGLWHLKTAGTSYLEAVRTVAGAEPALFRALARLARDRYAEDRATYHVSAELARMPHPDALADADLPTLLDHFDARQILHVTFGSVLATLGPDLLRALRAHAHTYAHHLCAHFVKHLGPLAA